LGLHGPVAIINRPYRASSPVNRRRCHVFGALVGAAHSTTPFTLEAWKAGTLGYERTVRTSSQNTD